MTDKINKTLKYIGEWQKKDYTEFTEKFENFVETLELTLEDAEGISEKLNSLLLPLSATSHEEENEFTLYASDFFVMILDDYNNNNEDKDYSRKYLIKD